MHSDMSMAIWKCTFWNPPAFLPCCLQEKRALHLDSLNLTHTPGQIWTGCKFLNILFSKKSCFVKTRMVWKNVSICIEVLMGQFLESRVYERGRERERGRKRSKAWSFGAENRRFDTIPFCENHRKILFLFKNIFWNLESCRETELLFSSQV